MVQCIVDNYKRPASLCIPNCETCPRFATRKQRSQTAVIRAPLTGRQRDLACTQLLPQCAAQSTKRESYVGSNSTINCTLYTVRITLTETPRGEFYTPMLSEKFFLRRSREATRATKHVFFLWQYF